MECRKLCKSVDLFRFTGTSISPEKIQLLKNSLLVVEKENHFKKTYFWGKIYGHKNDYYISYGHKDDCLKSCTYFYSINCLDWVLLPVIDKLHELLAPLTTSLLEGDPASVSTINVNELLIYNNNEEVIEVYETNDNDTSQYQLKEEDRLAAIVKLITDEAVIIPRGSWFKKPNGEIIENTTFEGLNLNEAMQLKSYIHTRVPREKWVTNLLTHDYYNYAFDFLDTAEMDVPKECWILQPHLRDSVVIIRNMFWPGMTCYHQINSSDYGYCYVGNGIKNFSVPFMI